MTGVCVGGLLPARVALARELWRKCKNMHGTCTEKGGECAGVCAYNLAVLMSDIQEGVAGILASDRRDYQKSADLCIAMLGWMQRFRELEDVCSGVY